MGLDMYLEHNEVYHLYMKDSEKYNLLVTISPYTVDQESGFITVNTTVGYWRKANQIHNWFVENVQGGVDDCRSYPVTLKQLIELKKLCEMVKDSEEIDFAKKYLPTRVGFFFGSTDYDELYWHDIDRTIEIITRIEAESETKLESLKKKNSKDPEGAIVFEYRSSW